MNWDKIQPQRAGMLAALYNSIVPSSEALAAGNEGLQGLRSMCMVSLDKCLPNAGELNGVLKMMLRVL